MEETARKIKENASCWYAVYTAPRAEKKVKEQLDKIGVENYLPLQPVVRLWNNRKKKIFIPVVPGCLFVHISSEEIAHVAGIHGVAFLLKEKGQYVSIPEVQMETFKTMIEHSCELYWLSNVVSCQRNCSSDNDKFRIKKIDKSGNLFA